MIRFACPRCTALHECPEHKGGLKITCLKCGQRLQIPMPSPSKTILGTLVPATSVTGPSPPDGSELSLPPSPSCTSVPPPPLAPAPVSQPPSPQQSSGRKGLIIGLSLGGAGLFVLLIVVLVLVLRGGSSTESRLLGQWGVVEGAGIDSRIPVTLTFRADGILILEKGRNWGNEQTGRYRIVDGETIEIDFGGGSPTRCGMSFSGNDLVLTLAGKTIMRLRRVSG